MNCYLGHTKETQFCLLFVQKEPPELPLCATYIQQSSNAVYIQVYTWITQVQV